MALAQLKFRKMPVTVGCHVVLCCVVLCCVVLCCVVLCCVVLCCVAWRDDTCTPPPTLCSHNPTVYRVAVAVCCMAWRGVVRQCHAVAVAVDTLWHFQSEVQISSCHWHTVARSAARRGARRSNHCQCHCQPLVPPAPHGIGSRTHHTHTHTHAHARTHVHLTHLHHTRTGVVVISR